MKHKLQGIDVPRETLNKTRDLYQVFKRPLENYIDYLLDWNEKINLISRSVSRETLREHLVHSLIPVTLGLTDKHDKWIDSGSGGGLPGIPLAICKPQTFWYLNDNVKKKMRAVADILRSMELKNAEVLPKSISLVDLKRGTGIATKHAFKIDDLLRHLGDKPWKTILMWKGAEGALQEIKSSGKKLNYTIYEFNFGEDEPFYEGKSLVLIER